MKHVRLILLSPLMALAWPFLFSASSLAHHNPPDLQKAARLYREANRLSEMQEDSLALAKYREAKSIYIDQAHKEAEVAGVCLEMGIIYQTQEKFKQAISAYRESILYLNRIRPVIDSSYVKPFLYLGTCFIGLNQFDSAYVYLEKAETVLARYPALPEAQRLYNTIGYLFHLSGNYGQSINYFEKALTTLKYSEELFDKPDKHSVTRYVVYNNNISGSLRKLGNPDKAIQKAKSLIRYKVPEMSNVLYQNIASSYLQMEKYDSAKIYLDKIKSNILSSDTRFNPTRERIDYYNSLGLVYSKTGKFTDALSCFDFARQLIKENFSLKNEDLAIAYLGKGDVYASQKKYLESLQHYQSAIQSLHYTFNNTDIYKNPSDLNGIVSPLPLIEVLLSKAKAFRKLFAQKNRLMDLEEALSTYQLAFGIVDQTRRSYDLDEAKLFFIDKVSPAYEEAIATAHQLFLLTREKGYQEASFALAEQSKSAVLTESLRELQIRQVPGIDQGLLQRENDLKRNLAALNIRLAEADSAKRVSVQPLVRDTEIELERVLKQLEKHEQYYKLKYDTKLAAVSQIQRMLDGETALIEYFVGKNNVYAYVITHDFFEAKQVGLTTALLQNWEDIYSALYQAEPLFKYRGNKAGHHLYQQLILPLASAIAGKRRLVIVQDKELCHLPFEALVSDPATERYLLQDYVISYAYSAKLLRPASEKSPNAREISVLAMAPFVEPGGLGGRAGKEDNLLPLPASGDEVAKIGGQVYMGQEATKEKMRQGAGSSDIIHLATHAKADNQEPLRSFISFFPQGDSFSNYRLYVEEIYNLHFDKLKLVVLSACETGSGKIINGEGTMSLARAFAYAGCPSTVTTLWKASDNSTAAIATRFYDYLKAGTPKDEALRLAKLDYLENQENWRLRSPAYWANFISIGDQAPIYANSDSLWRVMVAVLVGISGIGIWVVYRKSLFKGQA